jgi:hypothetical protein
MSAYIWPVSSSQHDDTSVALEAIHLCKKLVDGLLPLVVSTAHAGTTLASDSINLINEDDAGGLCLGLHGVLQNVKTNALLYKTSVTYIHLRQELRRYLDFLGHCPEYKQRVPDYKQSLMI